MIDVVPEQFEEWFELLSFAVAVLVAVLVGSYLLGHRLPVRLAMPIFGVGTTVIALLAYRLYQSQVDYCKGSYEVEHGGDKFSCLEPQHWFANALAVLFFLLVELGLTVFLAAAAVRWQKQRRL